MRLQRSRLVLALNSLASDSAKQQALYNCEGYTILSRDIFRSTTLSVISNDRFDREQKINGAAYEICTMVFNARILACVSSAHVTG